MTKKQIVLIIAGLILLGIVGGIIFKLFAEVPEIESTPEGKSAAFWRKPDTRSDIWGDSQETIQQRILEQQRMYEGK